jgi:hypothetical protein
VQVDVNEVPALKDVVVRPSWRAQMVQLCQLLQKIDHTLPGARYCNLVLGFKDVLSNVPEAVEYITRRLVFISKHQASPSELLEPPYF